MPARAATAATAAYSPGNECINNVDGNLVQRHLHAEYEPAALLAMLDLQTASATWCHAGKFTPKQCTDAKSDESGGCAVECGDCKRQLIPKNIHDAAKQQDMQEKYARTQGCVQGCDHARLNVAKF
eukprot:171979-Chlamydomonas_euryale.AAC.3